MSLASERRYHHGNLRAELLRLAERLVRERGVDALSLRELAREAGVSHAAPSRHFPDRRALLDALALQGFERLGEELEAAARPGPGGFDERLERVATTYVEFATRDAALLELMFAGKHREDGEALRAASDRAFSTMLGLMAEGQAEGHLAGDDPQVPGTLLFATLQGIAALRNGGMAADRPVPEVVREALRAMSDGLRPR